MIERLATALLLADVSLAEWLKMPTKAQAAFAAAHGISPAELAAANRILGRYLISEAEVLQEHRCRALNALYPKPPALADEGDTHGQR